MCLKAYEDLSLRPWLQQTAAKAGKGILTLVRRGAAPACCSHGVGRYVLSTRLPHFQCTTQRGSWEAHGRRAADLSRPGSCVGNGRCASISLGRCSNGQAAARRQARAASRRPPRGPAGPPRGPRRGKAAGKTENLVTRYKQAKKKKKKVMHRQQRVFQ